ncbi:hypothetical protein OSTOST_21184, partial [Ostertagia ostertagi]
MQVPKKATESPSYCTRLEKQLVNRENDKEAVLAEISQAPEVISTRVYTAKCDVYSYGILLWEIFNNGETPYKGIDNKTVREKISDPKFRPPTDATLPIVIYRVMKTCWRANPVKRPSMAQVARYLVNAPPELFLPKSAESANRPEGSMSAASATAIAPSRQAPSTGRRSKSCPLGQHPSPSSMRKGS